MRAVSVPDRITDELKDFTVQLRSEPPQYIPVKPAPGATPLNCHVNVKVRVKHEGGSIVYGWALWEMAPVFLEAHFHAIWSRSDGQRIDITPPQDGENKLLFARDRNRVWAGKKVPHQYFPLARNRRAIAAVSFMGKLRELECEFQDTRVIPESFLLSAIHSSALTLEEARVTLRNTQILPRNYSIQSGC